jgi:DNA-binding MarR family transcriptional regulator
MSSRLPATSARERPENLAVLLRETFVALNDWALARLAARGHEVVRAPHGAVFQYLDDAGTTVSVLAGRAQVTKQAMAELVRHLEDHGYVERVPNPQDRRAKLVRTTDRGREVFAVMREQVAELEERVTATLGTGRAGALREDLDALRRSFAPSPPEERTG